MTTFSALCRAFLSEEHEASPVMASGLGLTEFDDRLDDLSEAAIRERQRQSAAWRVRFRAVPDTGLTPDERIDRDLSRGVPGDPRDPGASPPARRGERHGGPPRLPRPARRQRRAPPALVERALLAGA